MLTCPTYQLVMSSNYHYVLFFYFTALFIALATSSPAGEKKTKAACGKACPFNYEPICAEPAQSGSGKPLSFGNECVLETYNCEHPTAKYVFKTKSECPGSNGVRLS